MRHVVQAPVYWRNPFRPLAMAKQLVEYVVLDIEPLGPQTQKHALAEVQVCINKFDTMFSWTTSS